MVVILCNCSVDEAEGLARALVTSRLAACVNILPGVHSVYIWEGAVQEEQECTLLIKAADAQVEALSERIRELHSYSTPEILVLPVDVERSDEAYVNWVRRG